MADNVNAAITDAVTHANVTTLGSGQALAADQSYLASSQFHATIFASAVREQRQLAMASLAATIKGVAQILALSRGAPPGSAAFRGPEQPQPRPEPAAEPAPSWQGGPSVT